MNDLVPTNDRTGLAFVLPQDFPDLDQAELGMRLEKQYYDGFKNTGDRVRAIFNGMDHLTTKNNGQYTQIPAVCFQTHDGVWLHGGAGLVEQLRTIPPGTPVQITFLGSEKTGSGNNVNKFEVRLLKVNVKAVMVEPTPDQPTPAPVPPKAEAPIPSEPGAPEPPDHLVFTNTELATDFWTKARTLGLTRDEGLVHLAAFGNDFKQGLEAL